MKIRKVVEYQVTTGDTITVGVTHEIKVGRESSWVKYELTHSITEEDNELAESGTDIERVITDHVNSKVMGAVEVAVNEIRARS